MVKKIAPDLRVITPVSCAKCLWLKCLLLEDDENQVQKTVLEILTYLKCHHGLKSNRLEACYSFLKVQKRWQSQ